MRVIVLLVTMATMSACAAIPPDRGASEVDGLLIERGVSLDRAGDVAALTAEPLSAATAARIALINGPQLQRLYASLGVGSADLYRASRPGNPHLGWIGPPGEHTLEIAVGLIDLLTLPRRAELAREEFAALQRDVGAQVFAAMTEVELAYYEAVGARQVAALHARAAEAATLSAELAERFSEAGNMTPRDYALERTAASVARIRANEAERAATDARNRLAGLLGLPFAGSWSVPTALPDLAPESLDVEALVARAGGARLDLAAARLRTEVLAGRLGVTRWTRWTGDIEVGMERERDATGAHDTGATLAVDIPIFDQRADRVVRGEAELALATIDLQALARTIENDVRHAHAALTGAAARVAEYRFELVPQRQAVVARTQEEVNFMIAGVFELLVAKRQEYEAWQGYLESVRDYWQARARLSGAVGGTLPEPADAGMLDLDELLDPAPPRRGGHQHHGNHE